MIVYNDILKRLAACGWTSYRLRRENKLGEATLTSLRHGAPITTETIDVICELCNCQPGDFLTYVQKKAGE